MSFFTFVFTMGGSVGEPSGWRGDLAASRRRRLSVLRGQAEAVLPAERPPEGEVAPAPLAEEERLPPELNRVAGSTEVESVPPAGWDGREPGRGIVAEIESAGTNR